MLGTLFYRQNKGVRKVMNEVTIFENKSFGNVRVVEQGGEPWFVAKDVCEILGIANNRDAVGSLEEDEKGVVIADTLGGKQEVSVVSESGLYALIFRSRKPEAKAFSKWVRSDVLPVIRKTGAYSLKIEKQNGLSPVA